MVPVSKRSFSWLSAVGYTFFVKVSGLVKATYVFGSIHTFFSGVAVISPLAGAFGGVQGSMYVFFANLAFRFFLTGIIGFQFLAYHIPGFFASLAWTTRSKWLHIGVPILCMSAFIAHPVGQHALPYTFFWFIPMILAFFSPTPLVQALGSTFIAHAIGSVIWIYAVPMTAAAWYALIPVVIAERFSFACAMVAVYHIGMYVLTISWSAIAETFRRMIGIAY
jgi:hypothetical protein